MTVSHSNDVTDKVKPRHQRLALVRTDRDSLSVPLQVRWQLRCVVSGINTHIITNQLQLGTQLRLSNDERNILRKELYN